jgi:oligoribonuclease NrnB/cAMP/cGMP phosphodiesterase (DHH superfamily)
VDSRIKIVEDFSKYLEEISYPPDKKSSWQISGRLRKSNQIFKFDVRDMFKLNLNQQGKYINLKSRANKVVFESPTTWIILDMDEFNSYIKKTKLQKVHLEDLLSKFDWSIIVSKG